MGLRSAGEVTHRKSAEDFGRFWKSQWVEMRPSSREDGWLSLAHGDRCGGCHTCWGCADEKARLERLCRSPYVEEPLNSKVIKGFVPEQRSRYVFFEFRDSYVLSLWTFDVRFTHSHIMAMIQWHINLRGRLNTKVILINEHQLYYSTNSYGVKSEWYLSQDIFLKLNLIARQELELASSDVVVQLVNFCD